MSNLKDLMIFRRCDGKREECKEWPSFCYKNGGPCKWVRCTEKEHLITSVSNELEHVSYPPFNNLYFEKEMSV